MRKFIIYTLFWVNLLALILLWWNNSGSLFGGVLFSALIALGRLAGLLAMFFILVQLILVSRISFIEQIYGFDRLTRVHRKLGYILAISVLVHPILIMFGYALGNEASLQEQFFDFIQNWDKVFNAFLGLVAILVAAFFALPWIKKLLKYETWRFTHLLMYVGIFFIFGHQTESGDVSRGASLVYWLTLNITVFGLFLVYRFLKPFWLFYRHRFFVDRVVKETENVTSVYITGRNMERFKFAPGQYVSVAFLARGFLFPHPFSISCAPNGKYIRLSIKNLGDFTARIPKLPVGTKVIVEGPLGIFTERVAVTKKFLLVAGGIGITPIRAMVESLNQKKSDVILVYANKSLSDVPLKAELDDLVEKRKYVFSDKEEEGHEYGRINKEMLARFVPDIGERDIYICGPVAMIQATKIAVEGLGVPESQIHFEEFSY